MIIALHRLKMSIDDSKLQRIIEMAIKESETMKRKKIVNIKSEKMDKHIKRIQHNVESIVMRIDDFLLKRGGIFKHAINFFFNDTFGSLKQLKCELISRFDAEDFNIEINSSFNCKVKINGLVIRNTQQQQTESQSSNVSNSSNSSSGSPKPETAMIICNRGNYPYELMAYYDKWIECYSSYGVNIVLWNYRGYGESEGFSTVENITTDVIEVARFIKKEYGFTNIGVHGVDIGGISATSLAAQGDICFCFVDRSFWTLSMYMNKCCFPGLGILMKLFFVHDVNIAKELLSEKTINVSKVISDDLTPGIISDDISLKTGISNEFYKTFKEIDSTKTFLQNMLNDTDHEHEMFLHDINYVIKKILSVKEEEEKYDICAISGSSLLQTSQNRYTHANLESDLTSSVRLENNNLSLVNTNSNINSDNKVSIPQTQVKVISTLKIILEKFDAGGSTLLSSGNILTANQINNYFLNMLTWGSFRIGKVYASDRLIAYRAIMKKFSYLNSKINKIVQNPQQFVITDPVLTSSLRSLVSSMSKIEGYFNKLIFEKNEEEGDMSLSMTMTFDQNSSNSYRNVQISNFIKDANIGNLVILNCGHDGLFNEKELEMYSIYLLNSNFLK